MSTAAANAFERVAAELPQGADAALAALADELRRAGRYHELFEALKMRVRLRLGLPVTYRDTGDDLDPVTRQKLEEGLIDACREVGTLLVRGGKLREGWLYLRPVGDKREAVALLSEVQPDDDNIEEFIEVALHEGVDVARGFGAILNSYGLCNSITTFDTVVARFGKTDQQAAAALLVDRIHADLVGNLQTDIARQEGSTPAEKTLRELVAERDWMFGEGSYHVDTTHLSSVVRMARLLDDPARLRLALDLTAYGRRLHRQFQYQGDEPFADIYPSHGLYFQALLGENRDEALAYFKQKAETLDPHEHGTAAIEVYVDLLARCGQYDAAIDAAIALFPADQQPQGLAPSLLDLAERSGRFEKYLDYARQREDLLGYATGLVQQAVKK